MTANNNNTDWVLAYASVIGNGHIINNIPCQDSCAHLKINDTWGIAVVCDGAGSARLSHIGSDFVARNTIHCLQEIIERRKWETADDLPTEEDWRTEALRATQLVMQRMVQFTQQKEYKMAELGCTLLATLYSPFGLLSVHIGDGRAAYSVKPNEWLALITPYRGNEVNETVFITSNIWTTDGVDEYVLTNVKKGTIRGFALLSDGCENGAFEVNIYDEDTQKYTDPNRPFPRFFEPNVPGLRKLHEENKTQEEINTLWSGFLREGTKQFKHEIDDKTMILGILVQEIDLPESKKTDSIEKIEVADIIEPDDNEEKNA